jgi:hypothetical protein
LLALIGNYLVKLGRVTMRALIIIFSSVECEQKNTEAYGEDREEKVIVIMGVLSLVVYLYSG